MSAASPSGSTPHRYVPVAVAHYGELSKQQHAGRLGMWIFLASELLLFTALFVLYFSYRVHHPQAFALGVDHNPRLLGTINTCVLLLGSGTAAASVHALRGDRTGASRWLAAATALFALIFLCIKGVEWWAHFDEGIFPGTAGTIDAAGAQGLPIFFTLYFAMTGLHAIHVAIGGLLFLAFTGWMVRAQVGAAGHWRLELGALYWHFVDAVWVFLWPLFYLLGEGT